MGKKKQVKEEDQIGLDGLVVETIEAAGNASEIQQVFDHWVERCRPRHRVQPILSPKRRAKIANAINLYGVEVSLRAIDGCLLSDFHQGGNPNGKKYDELELILRDSEHIERFANLFYENEKSEFPRRLHIVKDGEPF